MAVKLRPARARRRTSSAMTTPGVRHPHAGGVPGADRACGARIPRPASPTSRSSAPCSASTRSRRRRSRRRLDAEPLASFATATLLLAAHLQARRRRRRRGPGPLPLAARRAGEQHISRRRGAGARARLPARRARRAARLGPVAFELPPPAARREGDPIDDPTALWPDDREQVVAGTLEVERVVDDPERDGHIDVFDPTGVVDGIEPSDDPILPRARPRPTRCPPTGGGTATPRRERVQALGPVRARRRRRGGRPRRGDRAGVRQRQRQPDGGVDRDPRDRLRVRRRADVPAAPRPRLGGRQGQRATEAAPAPVTDPGRGGPDVAARRPRDRTDRPRGDRRGHLAGLGDRPPLGPRRTADDGR